MKEKCQKEYKFFLQDFKLGQIFGCRTSLKKSIPRLSRVRMQFELSFSLHHPILETYGISSNYALFFGYFCCFHKENFSFSCVHGSIISAQLEPYLMFQFKRPLFISEFYTQTSGKGNNSNCLRFHPFPNIIKVTEFLLREQGDQFSEKRVKHEKENITGGNDYSL